MIPTIGRIVRYTLSAQDATTINKRRRDANQHLLEHRTNENGVIVHVGNGVSEGDAYPMIITRCWGKTPESCVNGQVLLDGNDTLWVTSVSVGEGPRHFAWPERA